jgi:hypothetical protein
LNEESSFFKVINLNKGIKGCGEHLEVRFEEGGVKKTFPSKGKVFLFL